MARSFVFTSESVSEGHPDKICDRISDALLDLYLASDPYARTAIETVATTNRVMLIGEIRAPKLVTQNMVTDTVRRCVRDIGYEQDGFHWKYFVLENFLHEQSADIAVGVDATEQKDEGAGDQGIMFGYASDETPSLMPAPLYYAHRILQALSALRRAQPELGLQPDAKSQVSLWYEQGVPVRATSIVVSTQHVESLALGDLREIVRKVVTSALPEGWMCPEEAFYVNPTGRFVIGGPDGDAGLTGRKIIVDTYGGAAPHGGGAFSGKDPTKVDRTAAYTARYLAKNVVAAGLAKRCTIQLSYAIGISKPLSVYVNTHKANVVDELKLGEVLQQLVDLSPRNMRTHLQLNRPIFARTAAYGHFGRDPEADGGFSWEKTDLAPQLKAAFGI
ncbi:MAG: methionine adenosyltransferase [Alphaproteobacteria bacterium]|nr:methionine adenosyltransferase [Alphaproteobacteria bacterium]